MAEVTPRDEAPAPVVAVGATDAAAGEKSAKLPPNPEEKASCCSKLFFWYLSPLFRLGSLQPLEATDIPEVNAKDCSTQCYEKFKHQWEREDLEKLRAQPASARGSGSIFRASRRFVGLPVLRSSIYYAIYVALSFAPPVLLKTIVSYLEGSAEYPMWVIWLCVVGTLTLAPMASLVQSQHNAIMSRAGVQLRTAYSLHIYRKGLRLSSAARQSKGTGEIVNIMSNDADKPVRFFLIANALWAAPLQIFLCLYLISREVGVAMWFAFIVLAGLIPINIFVFKQVAFLRRKILSMSDARVKLVNEILSGIKIIKLYCWDQAFAGKAQGIRIQEIKFLRRFAYLVGIAFSVILLSVPVMLPVVVFAAASSLYNVNITASKAFTVISLFNILRFPFAFLPLAAVQWVTTVIAMKRIQNFLLLDEIDPKAGSMPVDDSSTAVLIEDGDFKWDTVPVPQARRGRGRGRGRGRRGKESGVDDSSSAAEQKQKKDGEDLSSALTLSDINLSVPVGQLVAIVGPVGCGKSSLLSAVLGEIKGIKGRVGHNGKIAYAAQQPWIMNGLLKENVTFGLDHDEERYREAIRVCAMDADIRQIRGGDEAEIGERGINLSGGQKARVSLARTVYADRDVYLLDDPLSAVDAHVGEHIFEHCITGKLRGKTILLVTNALQYLPRVDRVVVMKAGAIVADGTYDELVAQGVDLDLENVDDKDMEEGKEGEEAVSSAAASDAAAEEKDAAASSRQGGAVQSSRSRSGSQERSTSAAGRARSQSGRSARTTSGTDGDGGLIEEEERNVGSVSADTYRYYLFKSMGLRYVLMWTFAGLLQRSGELAMPFILSAWSDYTVKECEKLTNSTFGSIDVNSCELPSSNSTRWYLNLYGIVGACTVICVAVRGITLAAGRVHASETMHGDLVNSVMRAPMSFFDTTPLGRILNRFSRDVEVVDNELGSAVSQVFGCILNVTGALVAVILATKGIFLAPAIPVLFSYHYISTYYRKTSTEVKRLESISKSPIFALFSETLTGVSTIRAFQQQDRLIAINNKRFDANSSLLVLLGFAGEWLAIRLDMTSSVISFCVAAYAIAARSTSLAIPAGWTALALAFSFETTNFLKHAVRMYAVVEASMNSVERIKYYTHELDQEAFDQESVTAPPDWPSEGRISIQGLKIRYRPKLPLVLKGLDLEVAPGQRVGIVGRTGAGKSTLTLALFRLIEAAEGTISIDGLNIADLDLRTVRANLSIIPQDPVLWSCSVRENLDPFDTHSDVEVWRALEQVGLKETLQSAEYEGGLSFMIAEGGTNFSVGQRQLFCIARALLRNSKVLLLDEATASIDRATDSFIQRMIRTSFQGCTILVIAHRLNTIADFDRVLVLDAGESVEYDTPLALIDNPQSVFGGMVRATGEASARVLRDIATGACDVLDVEDITLEGGGDDDAPVDTGTLRVELAGEPAAGKAE